MFPSIVAADGDREGFGLVLVEALGCECAAVVTDLPAMRDIVHDGKTALVVPQQNAQQIAAKVIQLLDNPSLRRSLGEKGRQYVVQRFDWKIVAKKYSDLINMIIRWSTSTQLLTVHCDSRKKRLMVNKDEFLLSVVIPVYNEEETIEEIINRVIYAPYRKEIIVVDDGSTDGTRNILNGLNNPALKYVIMIKTTARAELCKPVLQMLPVISSWCRMRTSNTIRGIFSVPESNPFGKGRRSLRFTAFWPRRTPCSLFLALCGQPFPHIAFQRLHQYQPDGHGDLLQGFHRAGIGGNIINENRFGFEPEITAKIARKRNLRIYEVPISYYGRTYDEGKENQLA